MPNDFFRFKQFTIYQDQCAMKVCTDACLFGAWFADKIHGKKSVLDIGAGTGLLSLMLAQKNEAIFHAIEINHPSFEQLEQNINASLWKNHITAMEGDATTFNFPMGYDFIITNPPFYEGDLLSPDNQKNFAKHHTGLTLLQLTEVIQRQLTKKGNFGILLPYHRTHEYIVIAEKCGFYLCEQLLVKQTAKHDFFRSILHFSRQRSGTLQTYILAIRDDHQHYTPEFTSLLKDYYLYL